MPRIIMTNETGADKIWCLNPKQARKRIKSKMPMEDKQTGSGFHDLPTDAKLRPRRRRATRRVLCVASTCVRTHARIRTQDRVEASNRHIM